MNIGSSESYFDMHVGQAFIRRWRAIKTGVARRENEAACALTNLIKRIFGFDELEINPAADIRLASLHRREELQTARTRLRPNAVCFSLDERGSVRANLNVLIDEPS